jgi:regulator of sigma E protease
VINFNNYKIRNSDKIIFFLLYFLKLSNVKFKNIYMWLLDFVRENTLWVIEFIVMFSFLIIVHEFGHFYAARKSGVKVFEFAVGFGKRLYSKKIGETEYCLNLIPFGGYVRMLGEEEESAEKGSFGQAKLWQRMMISLGGVFMNFLSAIIILTVLFTIGTSPILITKKDIQTSYEEGYFGYKDQANVYYTIADTSWEDVHKKENITGGYLKDIKKPLMESFLFSFSESFRMSKAILVKVSDIPSAIMETHRLPEGMAGPLGIAEVTKKVSELGFIYLVKMAALLSVSLGVMNLLPIPALDGGRFFFQLIELILIPFKIKPSEKIENYAHMGGMFLLFGFLIAVTIEDVIRIFF